MRKVAAILLVLIFFFNLVGYQFVFSILQTKADQKLEALIDNNEYNDAELIELRVQLDMPYQYRFTDFERHYGQVTIDGKEYTYVKRKVEGDVLILKCIPNTSKTALKNIAADITKANSNNTQGESPVKSSVKVFSFECDEAVAQIPASPDQAVSSYYIQYADKLNNTSLSIPHQPPRC
ncbi:MAG: hypothetical protein U0U70_01490 [Chitinophagaceae bacterium]